MVYGHSGQAGVAVLQAVDREYISGHGLVNTQFKHPTGMLVLEAIWTRSTVTLLPVQVCKMQ